MTPPSHLRYVIKICGVSTEGDALAAADAGATAVGLNFWPRSPRYVSLQQAAKISRALPDSVLRVGVFVNPSAENLIRTVAESNLDVAQIHGSMPEQVAELRIWKAAMVDSSFSSDALSLDGVEAFLLDSPTPKYGGSGCTFEWNRVTNIRVPFLLAGGLDASNVQDAIAIVKPWGVDSCSKLESAPGKKDRQKMREFVEAAERAFQALAEIDELVR
ncbi:MAG TPA: phosphoribosylanthranilate isomerase [Bryobacteraceae bacterium]|nr:phosphoribosylanthranilate isomerase [Bryobacteraceae bacterium]